MVGTKVLERSESLTIEARAALLRAIADPVRLAVLDTLALEPRCHCEMEEALVISSSRLSFHLKVLRDAGLVQTRRRGRLVEYHLDATATDQLVAALPARAERP